MTSALVLLPILRCPHLRLHSTQVEVVEGEGVHDLQNVRQLVNAWVQQVLRRLFHQLPTQLRAEHIDTDGLVLDGAFREHLADLVPHQLDEIAAHCVSPCLPCSSRTHARASSAVIRSRATLSSPYICPMCS